MEIKPVSYQVKRTLRAKQETPRALLDSLLPRLHFARPPGNPQHGDRLARNIDTNPHTPRALVDECLYRANL